MIIDGNQLASEIQHELIQELERLNMQLNLLIIQVGEHAASSQYIRKKVAFAKSLGIYTDVRQFDAIITETELKRELRNIIDDIRLDPYMFTGIIIQLPLPKDFDTQAVLDEIPKENDIDLLSEEAALTCNQGISPILPPVIGALAFILEHERVSLMGKRALVIGKGKLVGAPAAIWLGQQGALVTIADKNTKNLAQLTHNSDVIISGVGTANIIKPDMIKKGLILIDAGTSDSPSGERRQISGDADPRCAEKCTIFTPVPGGVGPLTVSMLFRNLVTLARTHSNY